MPRELSVAFVGFPSTKKSRNGQLMGVGKVTASFFLPHFARTLSTYSMTLRIVWPEDLLLTGHRSDVAILVYNEDFAGADKELVESVAATEAAGRQAGMRIVHSVDLGRLLFDKTRTNQTLSAAGIPVPPLFSGEAAPSPVFSNANLGSHLPVSFHEAGVRLDPSRYNTAFVDTRFSFAGNDYYVALRAMCVGGSCVSIIPRARPVSDRDPSVHTTDTPHDAALLNALNTEIIQPRRKAILDLCHRIGEVFGLGFYAHDILPARASEELFVCESGFKFDDGNIRRHLEPLKGRLDVDDYLTEALAIKASHAFAAALLA